MERHRVRDNDGIIPVTKDYIQEGINGDWLIYEGSFRDDRDILWHTYRLRGTIVREFNAMELVSENFRYRRR